MSCAVTASFHVRFMQYTSLPAKMYSRYNHSMIFLVIYDRIIKYAYAALDYIT
jgi:hypothetical protein